MKKIVLTLTVLLVFVFSCGINAFAETDFTKSPSDDTDIKVTEYYFEVDRYDAWLIVTAYKNRHTLTDQSRQAIEKAYETIKQSKWFSELSTLVVERAKAKGIAEKDLSISNLFDISYFENGIQSDQSGAYHIKLESGSVGYFVDLMQYIDGKWVVIENASVDGDVLTFRSENVGEFAIVVNESAIAKTGDTMLKIAIPIFVGAVALIAIIIVYRKIRKEKTDEE